MTDPVHFHLLTRADLKAGNASARWSDPELIASIAPQNLNTILANPCAGGDAEVAQILAVKGDRIIGRIDVLPTLIQIDQQQTQIFWGSNLYVPPEFRGTLTGVLLIMKAQSVHHTVGASGPSQAALPIYQKLKWADRPLNRYISILRSRSVVERYAGTGLHSKAAALLADAGLALHRGLLLAPLRAMTTSGLTVDRVEKMPDRLDPKLTAPRGQVSMVRSAAFLNWWLAHSFRHDSRNANDLCLIRDRDGNELGYFINKIRFHESATHRKFRNLLLGSLQDWMIFDPARLNVKQIIQLAIRQLQRRGVDAIEVCSDDPSISKLLKLSGFLRVGAMHMVIRWTPKSPLASSDSTADIAKWWIHPGDGDNFFV